MKNMASEIKHVTAMTPRVCSGQVEMLGEIIDTRPFEGMSFDFIAGMLEGSPTAVDIACKVKHCDTQTGEFVDITGATARVSGQVASLPRKISTLNLDIVSSNVSRYVMVSVTPTFTAGASPKIAFAATAVLGQARVKPIV
jgi:hypothetical protein